MTTYAYVYNGLIQQIIPLPLNGSGEEIPLDELYTPEFCAMCVNITGVSPEPLEGWVYDGGSFSPYVPPPLTAAQILANNTVTRNRLLAAANLVIPALQDAVDLEDPSANPALLLAWKQFRVAVNKVNLTVLDPTWPTPPQPGYGAAIAAPVSSS